MPPIPLTRILRAEHAQVEMKMRTVANWIPFPSWTESDDAFGPVNDIRQMGWRRLARRTSETARCAATPEQLPGAHKVFHL
jgi:hypothetical protein